MTSKVSSTARRNTKTVNQCRACDQDINQVQDPAQSACLGPQVGNPVSLLDFHWQNPVVVLGYESGQGTCDLVTAMPGRKSVQSEAPFMDNDDREP